MPGWKGSTRRNTLPPGWSTSTRPRILARDRHRCQWLINDETCGAPATDVDHIGDRNDHSDENLRALCARHHRRKSSAQGGRALWSKRPRRQRPTEPHPGLRDGK